MEEGMEFELNEFEVGWVTCIGRRGETPLGGRNQSLKQRNIRKAGSSILLNYPLSVSRKKNWKQDRETNWQT